MFKNQNINKSVLDYIRHLEKKIDSLYDTIKNIQQNDCPMNRNINDLEKLKAVFDELGIKYQIEDYPIGKIIELTNSDGDELIELDFRSEDLSFQGIE